jgi:hypothetical protein
MGKRYGSTYEAAAVAGLDLQTLKNLKTLAAAFEKSRRRDDLSLSHHDAVLGLDDPDMQDRFLARAAGEGLTRQQLRVLVRDQRRQERRWPEGKYGLILADPPWKYATGPGGYVPENHYPTLTSEEIASLPVADLTAHDCLLYLWVSKTYGPTDSFEASAIPALGPTTSPRRSAGCGCRRSPRPTSNATR